MATLSPSTLLSVENVSYSYSGISALDQVAVAVDEGEAVCIIGPNGAGKTTLANVIAGILRPATGRVVFAGSQISGLRPSLVPRHGIGVVLEGRHVFPRQSVQMNLQLGAYWRRITRTELSEAAERVYDLFPDLKRAASKPAGDLSGGQQQMLCVGRALMGNPRLLILDEPSMGLSPKLAGELYSALVSLRDSGLAILLIEQNAELAFDFCQRGYVLQYAQVVLEGTVAELRATDLVHKIYLGMEHLSLADRTSSPLAGSGH
jgi:branched-chain amino acid transport system ATP-binding protein